MLHFIIPLTPYKPSLLGGTGDCGVAQLCVQCRTEILLLSIQQYFGGDGAKYPGSPTAEPGMGNKLVVKVRCGLRMFP